MTRILWCSASFEASTGYGRVTAEIVSRLVDLGIQVEVAAASPESAIWGGSRQGLLPTGKTVTVRSMPNPLGDVKGARDAVSRFIQIVNPDLIIGHWDAFVLDFLNETNLPWISYCPNDGAFTKSWANYFRDCYHVVAYSLFGYNECKKFIQPSRLSYIQHGIDTTQYKPGDKLAARKKLRCIPPVPDDAFLFVTVAANAGDRKKIPLLLNTFRRLVKRHPEARLYLHTNPTGKVTGGYNLLNYIEEFRLEGNVHLPAYNPIFEAAPVEELPLMYQSADAYCTASCAEGFGLPTLEARATGLATICPNNSAQKELGTPDLLVDVVDPDVYCDFPVYVPMVTSYNVPNANSLLEKMERVLTASAAERDLWEKESREFALGYDWEIVMEKWASVLMRVLEDFRIFGSVLNPSVK